MIINVVGSHRCGMKTVLFILVSVYFVSLFITLKSHHKASRNLDSHLNNRHLSHHRLPPSPPVGTVDDDNNNNNNKKKSTAVGGGNEEEVSKQCKNAALILFGVPVHFQYIWKSYMKNIVQRNPTLNFEVYLHMYSDLHQKTFSSVRNNVQNALLESPDDIWKILHEGGSVVPAAITTSSQSTFDESELSWLQQSDTLGFLAYHFQTLQNMFRQGNSLRESLLYLQEQKKNHSKNDIDVYIFARPDTLLMTPIDIPCSGIGGNEIWVPSWGSWTGINDRFAIAGPKAANVYASRIKGYKEAILARRNNPKVLPSFVNSETMLKNWLLKNRVNVTLMGDEWAKMSRVRADGRMSHSDHPSLVATLLNATLQRDANGNLVDAVYIQSVAEKLLHSRDSYSIDIKKTVGPNTSSAVSLRRNRFATNFTFPTVEERVEYYMGSWHHKTLSVPATSPESSLCKDLFVASSNSTIEPERDTLYSFTDLQKRYQMPRSWQSVYLKDTANILSHVESHVDQGEDEQKYVILKTGDGYSPDDNKPVVAKSRRREVEEEVRGEDYYKSIIWPLRLDYHFSGIDKLRKTKQTQWDKKKEVVVWRGACTGVEGRHTSSGFARLVFVEKHKDNTNNGIDVALKGKCANISNKIQIKVDRSFYRGAIDMAKLLQYKYLLSLEGNDVSTGLKWMLASNSVVFMPLPTAVSFTMESKLVPYVHYVPVKKDGSDLLSQLEWAKNNDDKCKWISEQASQYIDNLWSNDQAQKDLIVIKHFMGKMYHEKFSKALAVCHSGCPADKVCSGPTPNRFDNDEQLQSNSVEKEEEAGGGGSREYARV